MEKKTEYSGYYKRYPTGYIILRYMVEQHFPTHDIDPRDYRLDGEPRAFYHWQYRKRYEEVKNFWIPGTIIVPERIPVVAIVANSFLRWDFFDLRNQDRIPVDNVTFPGKSVHVDFTQSNEGHVTKEEKAVVCDAVFGRDCRREDHLYYAYLAQIIALGFVPYCTPLPNHPLHIRLVHQLQIDDPDLRDISKAIKEQMVKLWTDPMKSDTVKNGSV